MHEHALARDLLRAVERAAGGQRVVAVNLSGSAGGHLSLERVAEQFALLAAGTVAEGAVIRASEASGRPGPALRIDTIEVEE